MLTLSQSLRYTNNSCILTAIYGTLYMVLYWEIPAMRVFPSKGLIFIQNKVNCIVNHILQFFAQNEQNENTPKKLDKIKYKNIINLLENKPKIRTMINSIGICYSVVRLPRNTELLCQINNKQVFIEYCLSRGTLYKTWFRVYPRNQFKKNYLYLMTLHSKWMPNHSKWAL